MHFLERDLSRSQLRKNNPTTAPPRPPGAASQRRKFSFSSLLGKVAKLKLQCVRGQSKRTTLEQFEHGRNDAAFDSSALRLALMVLNSYAQSGHLMCRGTPSSSKNAVLNFQTSRVFPRQRSMDTAQLRQSALISFQRLQCCSAFQCA